MTPGARLQAAIEILEQSFAAPLAVDAIAEAYFRRRRYAGAGDRRAVQERLFGMLRRKARLEWHIARACVRRAHEDRVSEVSPSPRAGESPRASSNNAPLSGRAGESPRASSNNAPLSGRALALADLIVGEGLGADEAARLFASSRHAPAPLAEAEHALARALQGHPLDDPAMPDAVRLEYPAWLDPSLRAAFGERRTEEMFALNRPAPLDLRVNAAKATREEALAALAADGVIAEPTPLSPWGLRVTSAVRVGGTRAFKQGLVEVQDEGSQIVAALVGARPGMTVVDFCAGAGGKTLALAAAIARNGRVAGRLIACDTSQIRLERMTARLARAGTKTVRRVVLKDENDPALGNFANAERVLADVPCSASGAWRRDPLGKWRLTPEQLNQYVASQGRILDAAARLVRPGGRLVYATCSVLPEENEAQIAFFLERDNRFRIVPIAEVWSETLGGAPPVGNQFLRLTPAASGTDGFFAAVLERSPSAR